MHKTTQKAKTFDKMVAWEHPSSVNRRSNVAGSPCHRQVHRSHCWPPYEKNIKNNEVWSLGEGYGEASLLWGTLLMWRDPGREYIRLHLIQIRCNSDVTSPIFVTTVCNTLYCCTHAVHKYSSCRYTHLSR